METAKEKKIASTKVKIGHGGTLDPLQVGFWWLVLDWERKNYNTILLSVKRHMRQKPCWEYLPPRGFRGEIVSKNKIDHITLELIDSTVEKFIGDIKQTPPIFSALKVNGKPLYEYARKGLPLPTNIKVRDVTVNNITVIKEDSLKTDHKFTKLESELDEMVFPKNMG